MVLMGRVPLVPSTQGTLLWANLELRSTQSLLSRSVERQPSVEAKSVPNTQSLIQKCNDPCDLETLVSFHSKEISFENVMFFLFLQGNPAPATTAAQKRYPVGGCVIQ